MECFYCKKEILQGEENLRFIALDRPYVLLPFHRDTCLRIAEGEDLEQYLRDNHKRVYHYASSSANQKDNSIKRK